MNTERLEAFTDGVLAIIITIMILELKVPEGQNISGLIELLPKFLAYLFSFLVIAIYWNNHHHLMKATQKISAKVMWANMHLLFWLSLVPFATAWLGEHQNYLYQGPITMYSIVALLCGIAYFLLTKSIIEANPNSELAQMIGKDKKGLISLVLYILAIIACFYSSILPLSLIICTAIIWFIPDKRLQAVFK